MQWNVEDTVCKKNLGQNVLAYWNKKHMIHKKIVSFFLVSSTLFNP